MLHLQQPEKFLLPRRFPFPACIEGGAARPCEPDGCFPARVLALPAASRLSGSLGTWHASKMPRAFMWGEVFMRNCSVEDLGLKKKGLILHFLVIR